MPHRSPATATTSARTRPPTQTRIGFTDEPGNDPQQGPAIFEAWITDLSPTRAASSEAASVGSGHALTLHATLRRRGKLVRSLLISATIALPLMLLLHAVQASAAGQRPAASIASLRAPLTGGSARARAPWLVGAEHRDSADLAEGALDVQLASLDGTVVYACWVDAQHGVGGSTAAAGPLHLAASEDGAYTWRALPAPVQRATGCRLMPDSGDSQRVALTAQVGPGTGTGAGCPVARTFLSEDGGRHWSGLILPGAFADGCTPSLARQASPPAAGLSVVSGTLALWTNRAPPPSEKARSAQLWISLDFGATWRVAETGLPGGGIESVVSARPDGALLALVRRAGAGAATGAPASYELWSCPSGCPRWQRVIGVPSVPGSAPAVFATPGAWLLPEADWGTLYAVDTAQAATSIYINTEARDGAWRRLPPARWPGGEGATAAAMPSRVLGVGPGGSLVLELRNPALQMERGSGAQEQAAVGVVCAWDPVRGQWLTPLLVEPATSSALAVVWDEQDASAAHQLTIWFVMTIWLVTRSGEVLSVDSANGRWALA